MRVVSLFAAGPVLLLLGGLSSAADPDHAVPTRRADVVWIDGGWFHRGSDGADRAHAVRMCLTDRLAAQRYQDIFCSLEAFEWETPRRRIYVSDFGIDRTEVTHAAWRRCVEANQCPPPRIADSDDRLGRSDHPVAGVTWREAADFCAFVGGRLPTEAEWERAARGDDGRRFPWGRFYNERLANHGRFVLHRPLPDARDGYTYVAPVGSYPSGRSPFGLLDMAGNVFEWTADTWDPEGYSSSTRVDPRGPERQGGERVIRGGSWRAPAHTLRTTHRDRMGQQTARADLGFRCAYDPPPPP